MNKELIDPMMLPIVHRDEYFYCCWIGYAFHLHRFCCGTCYQSLKDWGGA